jgi:hypothetical protein
LPTVFGPVFVPAPAGPSVGAYRPGTWLAEPGFLSAHLSRVDPDDDARAEFVIWSVRARRIGALVDGPPMAVFPPAARFGVLAVQEADDGRRRVLLREVLAGSGASGPEWNQSGDVQIVERLHRAFATAGAESPHEPPGPPSSGWPADPALTRPAGTPNEIDPAPGSPGPEGQGRAHG